MPLDKNADAEPTPLSSYEETTLREIQFPSLHVNPDNPLNAAKLAAFQATYATGHGPLVGGYLGVLDNGGETVRLVRPDVQSPDEPL